MVSITLLICGDSKKSPTKKRGWATEHKNKLYIKCFNAGCDYSAPFYIFLKDHYPTFHSDYIKEKFDNKSNTSVKQSKVDLFASEYSSLNLQQIKDLPIEHKASLYLRRRKIPEKLFNEFYYSDNFSKWINSEIEKGAVNYVSDSDKRIVIPFYNKYKKIFVIQGRSIEYADPKYITYKTDKEADLIYGLDKIDFTKQVYVVEGIFDSLFLPNCLAVSGSLSDLKNILKYTSKDNIVVVPDNDRRNKFADKSVTKIIKQGFNTVVWPNHTLFKDINEAIIEGYSKEQLMEIINKNTFQGLMAQAKFKLRKL